MTAFKRATISSMLAVLAMSCGRPDFNTDLTEEGPPDVVLVAVASESLGEAATFCSDAVDPLRTNANYCPEEDAGLVPPVGDVQPLGFYVRFVFDELLDASIETVDEENGVGELAGTPVAIECAGTALAYGGFYDPSGSHLTFPAGPGLVIEPTDLVATGSDCTATLSDAVKDKSGESVPAAQRGPYAFTIAPLAAFGTAPEADAEDVDPTTLMAVQFNNFIDADTLATRVTLHDDTTDADVAIDVIVGAEDPTQVEISATAGVLAESTAYTVTITDGIADAKGGALGAAVTFSFTTGLLALPDAGI